MTLRTFILAALAAIPLVIAALDPVRPDMEQIRREVSDPASPFYYPDLMERYERNETIMTLDDYRHLYLGAIFEEDFNPYRRGQYSSLVEELYFKSRHSKAECDRIIKYAELALRDNPFDLQQIDYLIYALRERRKNNMANIWQYRLNHILEAIVSTGTGTDRENAWFVISPQHEYFLLNRLGHVATAYAFEAPDFDRITVTPKGSQKPVDYFFNSRHFLRQYRLKYPSDESDGSDGSDGSDDETNNDDSPQPGPAAAD